MTLLGSDSIILPPTLEEDAEMPTPSRSNSDGTETTVSIAESELMDEINDLQPDLELGINRRAAFLQSRMQPQQQNQNQTPPQSRRCSPAHSRRSSLDVSICNSTDCSRRKSMEESRHSLGQNFYVDGQVHEKIMSNFQDKSHTQKKRAKRSTFDMMKQNNWKFRHWMKYSLWTIWATVVMLVIGLGSWAFPDGNNPSCPSDNPDKNKATCGMEESMASGSKNLSFLTSFVLAGFLMSCRYTWIERRKKYGILCGATKNMLIHSIGLLPAPYRKLFARWTVLGFELSVLKARLLMNSNEGKIYLTSLGLATEDEWQSMVENDRLTTVWFWILAKARELRDRGEISENILFIICNAVALIRQRASDLMSSDETDQPPPYVFVCALLVNINLFFYATAQGFKLAVWMQDSVNIWTEPRFYVELVIVYLFTTIFAMLFDVGSLLYNPFGPRNIDLPHSRIGEGIRKLAKSLASDSSFETVEDLDDFGASISLNTSLHGSAMYAEQKVEMSSAQYGQETLLPDLGPRIRANFALQKQNEIQEQHQSRRLSRGVSMQRQMASRRLTGDIEPSSSMEKQKASRMLLGEITSTNDLQSRQQPPRGMLSSISVKSFSTRAA